MNILLGRMDAAEKRKWTLEQRKFLLAHHKEMFIEDIAEACGKTTSATINKAFRMGCSIKSKPKGDTE